MIAGYIIAIFVLLALSGFFSGSETALTAASRARMHALEKEGDKRAAAVNRLISNREGLIGSILLGNNVVNILASVLATSLFTQLFGQGGMAMAMATGVMTILVLVFAEVMPKTYAIGRPDAMAMSVAGIISVLVAVASWIVTAIQAIVSVTLKLVGLGAPAEAITADEEIRGAIDLHAFEGGVDAADRQRLVGALDLKELTVEDVMIHRKNIKMLSADLDPRQMVMKALASPHTRIPLYRGEKEEIVGILHAKDLLRAIIPLGGNLASLDLDSIMRKPWFVPETTPVQDQLDAFLKERSHFALVIDEYGELQGLITLEDILEEIVGSIHDEHDIAVQGVRPQEDGSVNVDGWVPIRDVNRAMNWNLPDDEAVTVAGLVIHEAQTIPEAGQSFVFHGYRFNVLRRQRNQVTGLNISVIEPA
ncbi:MULTISPECIES: HlyC/CorC family transporter [Hyphomonas]|uniref:CBS/transporter associated domain-containing protein n=2 Tax=Hyphomonas adhaerens TaxID=81029 RepID=A0A069E4E6_9PROT|nr:MULTISPECIES: HlyC/CorC family transporter [Hyphomonas]KCZ84938.1 CBS/transporter associated domain-containing protein [Hyphomonas adhaerens MHS-3]MBB39376.1 HlyC/CorC family transporter [Hyphomonas sp.]HAE28149.1 HlyC/CorC family transporter [Hyphomonas adhaerens]|tara:strand:+ start:9978 stop:11240 length:1263 start_codon:yes stop_codon:yes gene_type:complete